MHTTRLGAPQAAARDEKITSPSTGQEHPRVASQPYRCSVRFTRRGGEAYPAVLRGRSPVDRSRAPPHISAHFAALGALAGLACRLPLFVMVGGSLRSGRNRNDVR